MLGRRSTYIRYLEPGEVLEGSAQQMQLASYAQRVRAGGVQTLVDCGPPPHAHPAPPTR